MSLSEEEVKSVLDIYWDKVRKTLSSLEHTHVNLRGFGTFYLKPWSVDKKLKINDFAIQKHVDNPTASSLMIINEIYKDNIKLNAAKEKLIEQSLKKEKIKHERQIGRAHV